ncbi:MAG: hypothetical protein ACSHXL_03740 [Bacteroidota bacterium]
MKNEQIKKATKNLALWTLLWVVSLAVATFGPKFLWEGNTILSILTIAINAAFGAGMIWANVKHISALDELQKKIQLDAMGIALGVGIVGGLSYSVMDIANVISSDAEIGFLVMLISVSYMIALLIGKKRYA